MTALATLMEISYLTMVSTKIAMIKQVPSKQTKQLREQMKGDNRGKGGTFGKVVCPWLRFVSITESGIKLHAQVPGQHSKVLFCVTSCILLRPLSCGRSLKNRTACPI